MRIFQFFLSLNIISLFVEGIIVGFVLQMVDKGDVKGGVLATILAGIVGALVGGLIANLFFAESFDGFSMRMVLVGILAAVIGAGLHRFIFRNRDMIKTTTGEA